MLSFVGYFDVGVLALAVARWRYKYIPYTFSKWCWSLRRVCGVWRNLGGVREQRNVHVARTTKLFVNGIPPQFFVVADVRTFGLEVA